MLYQAARMTRRILQRYHAGNRVSTFGNHHPVRRICNVLRMLTFVAVLGYLAPAQAVLTSTLVDTPTGAVFGFGGGGQYDFASVSLFLNPTLTNWVAWSDSFGAGTPADPYACSDPSGSCIGRHGFGTNDFILLKVTNPGGTSSELIMDWNDSSGDSSGPQMIIFGTALAAPGVRRYNFPSGPYYLIDEAGAFSSSLFTTAGTYKFDFSFRDQHCCEGGHENVYLLVDTTPAPAPVPEPATLLLLGSGLAGIGGAAWRRKKKESAHSDRDDT